MSSNEQLLDEYDALRQAMDSLLLKKGFGYDVYLKLSASQLFPAFRSVSILSKLNDLKAQVKALQAGMQTANEELLQTLLDGIYSAGKYDCVPEDSIIAMEKQIFAKLNRCDELQAIVDKLPKTADGEPITPGMKVWFDYTCSKDYTSVKTSTVYENHAVDICRYKISWEKIDLRRLHYRHPETGKTVKEIEV